MNRLVAPMLVSLLLFLSVPALAFSHALSTNPHVVYGDSSRQAADEPEQDETEPDDADAVTVELEITDDLEAGQDAADPEEEGETQRDQNGDNNHLRQQVSKRACALAFGYQDLDAMSQFLLHEAKRQAIHELYGEVIEASSVVKNYILSDDQVRSDSRGIIRITGSPEPVNGRNVGQVCLTVDAYTVPEDRAPFEAVQLDGRGCDNSSNLSLPERKVTARNTALRNGLERYNPALGLLNWNVLSRLPKGIIEEEEEIRTDSNSVCINLIFSVIPIEVELAIRDTGDPPPPGDTDGFVFVPAGLFRMGSEKSADEKPVHDVYLDAFRISETPVTNAQYDQCVNAFGCSLPSNLSRYRDPAYQDHPVSGVTWEQAAAYAQWIGGRLPTEAEWEKACTGPSNWTYPWGDEPPDQNRVNFNRHVGDTTPVRSYTNGASHYGALDMAGNVWEWIGDWYAADYYAEAPRENPTGPEDGTARVLRGGSYRSNLDSGLRCADRFAIDPAQETNNIGFRIVIPDGEELSDQ